MKKENVKGTTKYLQYDIWLWLMNFNNLINEYLNEWFFFFFWWWLVTCYFVRVKFVLFQASLIKKKKKKITTIYKYLL